jgi:chaperone modulatory protein CbpM
MQTAQLIPINTFCIHHQVDIAFIHSLQRFGLIEIITIEETTFIPEDKVNELEKLVRLYHELEINLEGIDVITHLLERVKKMQEKIIALQNRLSLYEPGE